MNNNITLVTAYFDIGRKDFKNYPVTNNQYFEYFSVWARMKNNLVVYTTKNFADKIKEIRRGFGLENKTDVVIIDDMEQIENDLFKKMEEISRNETFLNFRYNHDAVENSAKYDYVMLLKYWCLKDAVEKGLVKEKMVAWIDFGFNHGNKCYIKPEEFDFVWKTKLNCEKIHIFSLHEIDKNIPVFKRIMNLDETIMGGITILSSSLCETFWNLIKRQMESLINIGFIDDDQLLILMAYLEKEELFEIHISDWFMQLKENGGEHLTVKEKTVEKKVSFINRVKSYVYSKKKKLNYLRRISEILK